MMHRPVSISQLEQWLKHPEEYEHLEFKWAETQFRFPRLVEYCVALANEGGGCLVLGVSDEQPRKILGTRAFEGRLQATKADLTQELKVIRVEADELAHPDGRVIVFRVPPRPRGMPLHDDGRYLMRSGEGLIPMTQDRLQSILSAYTVDYSSEVVDGAAISDLDAEAIEDFRVRWIEDSRNTGLRSLSAKQLLHDAGLVTDRGVTIAALILLGTEGALGRYLAQAEIVFEYRSSQSSIRTQQRAEYRKGFLLTHDDLWRLVALRNEVFHFQDGLFRREIPAFNEEVVREAILNAVAHRDYRLPGSVFIRQFPHKLEVESPGGLPTGITRENILWRREPRNRLLAESLERCGLVERSGQGMDIMFKHSIEEGKLPPDLTGTDEYLVHVTLSGQVRDERFVRMIEAVSREIQSEVTVDDLVVLDHIHRDQELPEQVKHRRSFLMENGIIERVGRGRGTRYLLSRRFYGYLKEPGVYTRKRGLDRETNKELLLRHIHDSRQAGSRFRDLHQVLPGLSRYEVQTLLRELKAEEKAHTRGVTRAARWYPGSGSD